MWYTLLPLSSCKCSNAIEAKLACHISTELIMAYQEVVSVLWLEMSWLEWEMG